MLGIRKMNFAIECATKLWMKQVFKKNNLKRILNMTKRFLVIIVFLFLTLSCASKNDPREYQVGAYLWQQRSGEYRALCYQAYNLARMNLALDLQDKHNRKRAVVFDIDETVLDNSFSGAYELKNHLGWSSELFNSWVKKARADGVAGAREFIDYAFENRVEVIYISNRTSDQIDDTLLNFKNLGIKARRENMIFMENEWSKEKRREEIRKKYDVVLYFGDNLHDFDRDFDNKNSDERKTIVDKRRQDFGNKFIILPNPLYGDWEKALPKNENKRELLIER
jgi:5'-nucleotidase (lipoprotein e(P4) family)